MKIYLEIMGLRIPTYSMCILLGMVVANVIAYLKIKKNGHILEDFIILEAYGFLGAFIGAKVLFLIVSAKEIEWNRMLDAEYFNLVMRGGFVFYGGLIGGVSLVLMMGNLHKINVTDYIERYIYLVPLIHGFGRVGCHFAGCCYGKEYSGILAVQFPKQSFAPAEVSLFPVQLVEAVVLLAIAFILYILDSRKTKMNNVSVYLVMYGVARFFLEMLRGDRERGWLLFLSTSQWISIILVIIGIIFAKKTCKIAKKRL